MKTQSTTATRVAFGYDRLQRLTGSTLTTGQPNPPSLSVTYDSEGNITDKHTADGVLTNAYTYGTLASGCAGVAGAVTPGPHAVSLAGGTRYCYDRDGNVLNGGRQPFALQRHGRGIPARITVTIALITLRLHRSSTPLRAFARSIFADDALGRFALPSPAWRMRKPTRT